MAAKRSSIRVRAVARSVVVFRASKFGGFGGFEGFEGERLTRKQRETTVSSNWSSFWASKIMETFSGGSSKVFKNAFWASVVKFCASSKITDWPVWINFYRLRTSSTLETLTVTVSGATFLALSSLL